MSSHPSPPSSPHSASQVALAEALAANGADVIQTEGGTSAEPRAAGVVGLMEKVGGRAGAEGGEGKGGEGGIMQRHSREGLGVCVCVCVCVSE